MRLRYWPEERTFMLSWDSDRPRIIVGLNQVGDYDLNLRPVRKQHDIRTNVP